MFAKLMFAINVINILSLKIRNVLSIFVYFMCHHNMVVTLTPSRYILLIYHATYDKSLPRCIPSSVDINKLHSDGHFSDNLMVVGANSLNNT